MKTTFQILTFFMAVTCIGQNLVLNPSFEDCSHCERSIGHFDKNVTDWSTPNAGSTDYFNYQSKESYNHYNGYQKSRLALRMREFMFLQRKIIENTFKEHFKKL